MIGKKGAMTDLVVFISFIFGLAILSGIVLYVVHAVRTGLLSHISTLQHGSTTNLTQVIGYTLGTAESTFSMMNWIIPLMFGGLVITFLISNAFIQTYRWMFIPYVLVVGISVFFSVIIANTYESITSFPQLASAFSTLIAPAVLIHNLPVIISVLGFIGGAILFLRMIYAEE